MADNRTTELREKLTERGVEFATDDSAASKVTMWTTQNGGWMFDCDYMEPLNEKPGTIGAKTELMIYGYTPEQAIAATLESDQEANLGDALNEVAEKWAEAQVSAEEYAKRCGMLESLAHDMFAYIDNCCESDLSFGCVDPVDCAYYDKARDRCTKASSLKQRMKALGLEVDR